MSGLKACYIHKSILRLVVTSIFILEFFWILFTYSDDGILKFQNVDQEKRKYEA